MSIQSSDTPLIVFRALMEKCVSELHDGAAQLHESIEGDRGRGFQFSAASLAQQAFLTFEHVQKIRYAKAFFRPALSSKEQELCAKYIRVEKSFENNVVLALQRTAMPGEPPPETKPSLSQACRKWLQSFLPGEVREEDLKSRMGTAKLTDVAPEISSALAEIVEATRTLQLEISNLQ
jgi:hypothetical protein